MRAQSHLGRYVKETVQAWQRHWSRNQVSHSYVNVTFWTQKPTAQVQYLLSQWLYEIISLIYIQKIEKDKEKTSPSKLGRICM